MQSSVSVRVPIWFSLMRIALAVPPSMPRRRRSTLVTKRSSPTSWTRPPMRSVRSFQPSQSSSAQPSSIEMIGYLSRELLVDRRRALRARCSSCRTCTCRSSCRRTRWRRSRGRRSRPCPACSRLPRWHGRRTGRPPRSTAKLRREAAFVADGDGEPLVLQELLQRVEDLRAAAHAPPRTTRLPLGRS